MFYYWYNLTDTPAILSRINIFFYINIRIFKIKLNTYISYIIVALNGFKIKNIKTFFNILDFEYIYFKFFTFFLILFLIFMLV